MLERDKGQKIDNAEQALKELDDNIDDCQGKMDDLVDKLN